MPHTLQKMNKAQVFDLAETLPQMYDRQDEKIRVMRELRELTHVVEIPERLVRIQNFHWSDSTIADEMDQAVAALTHAVPKLTVTVSNPSSGFNQKNATIRERFTTEAFKQMATRVPGENVMEQIVDAAVCDGAAWVWMGYDTHIWDEVWKTPDAIEIDVDKETGAPATDDTTMDKIEKGKKTKTLGEYKKDRNENKKATGIPFRMRCADALTIYPIWRSGELVAVLEKSYRPLFEINAIKDGLKKSDNYDGGVYGESISEEENMQYHQSGVFYALWTATHCYYACENPSSQQRDLIKVVEHGYGHVPWYPMYGRMKNHWHGRKVGDSLGENKKQPVRERMFLWNLFANIAVQTAGTPMVHTRPEGGEGIDGESGIPEGEDEKRIWELQEILEGKPGEDYKVLQLPGIPQPLIEILRILNEQIQSLTIPKLSAALGSDLAGAGFGLSQISTEIQISYSPFALHIADGYKRMTRDFWKLCRKYLGDEELFVQFTPSDGKGNETAAEWLGVVPNEDLTDGVGIEWLISHEPPQADIVRSRYWHERLDRGTAHKDQVIAALGDNPDEVQVGLLIDKLRNEGVLLDYQIQVTMEGLKIADRIREAADQAVQGMQLPVPGASQQPGFGVPMQGPGVAGGPQIPDMGALALAPNGQGAAPMTPPGIPGPGSGATPGVGQAMGFTQNGATAGLQSIGPMR